MGGKGKEQKNKEQTAKLNANGVQGRLEGLYRIDFHLLRIFPAVSFPERLGADVHFPYPAI
jgi:hypothetical protein